MAKKPLKQKVIKLENKITKLLDQAKVKYNLIQHKVVYTAHDTAQTTKKKLSEIAKVVLVKVETTKGNPFVLKGLPFVLVILPAGKYVNFAEIKKALKAKKVSMATEKDITKYLKTKIGLLHPFGSVYNLQTLLDKTMSKAKKIIASAGSYTHSIEITVKDFERLTQPIKGIFAKNKK
jgi:Ala-tRNA(Pro) deacylase